MGYSFRLAARVLLYASSHRQDSTYHGLCYTSRGALTGMRNSSMGPPWGIDQTTMSERSYHGGTSRSFFNERERNVLFNDALNTFYLRLYGVRHMVKDHSDSEREYSLTPHGLLFQGWQQGFFYMHHPTDRMAHTMVFGTPVVENWLEWEIAQWVHHEGSIRRPWAKALTTEVHLAPFLWMQLQCWEILFSGHDRCNKGRGMCYPVCGIRLIKEPLLLIGKSSLCGGSGFPLSVSEWSFTIWLSPYNRK